MVKLRLKPETGQENDPFVDRASFPAEYPSIEQVVAERRQMESALRAYGVRDRDVPDMVQDVTVAAWLAIGEGRYRPDPARPAGAALRAWLGGIVWRQTTHYLERASNRREATFAKPQHWLRDRTGRDPYGQLLARDALRAVALLPPRYRAVVSAFARGKTIAEYAEEQGMDENTAWTHLRYARKQLRKYLAGRGWRRP